MPKTSYADQAAALIALCAAAPVRDAPLRAFHNDHDCKASFLGWRRVLELAAAIQRAAPPGLAPPPGAKYAADDTAWEQELGIPPLVGALWESLFAHLGLRGAGAFLVLPAAIPVGADMSGVWPRFLAWLLGELAPLSAHAAAARRLYERCAAGEDVPSGEWAQVVAAAEPAIADAALTAENAASAVAFFAAIAPIGGAEASFSIADQIAGEAADAHQACRRAAAPHDGQ